MQGFHVNTKAEPPMGRESLSTGRGKMIARAGQAAGRRERVERVAQRRTVHLNSFVRSAKGQNVPKREGSRPSHPLGGRACVRAYASKEPV